MWFCPVEFCLVCGWKSWNVWRKITPPPNPDNFKNTWIIDVWKTNLMSLAILFHLLCAQYVSTLIYPSSGACNCVDELPHRSSCSQFVVCWSFCCGWYLVVFVLQASAWCWYHHTLFFFVIYSKFNKHYICPRQWTTDWRVQETSVSNYRMFALVNVFLLHKSVPISDYTATNGEVMYEYSHFLSYNQLTVWTKLP